MGWMIVRGPGKELQQPACNLVKARQTWPWLDLSTGSPAHPNLIPGKAAEAGARYRMITSPPSRLQGLVPMHPSSILGRALVLVRNRRWLSSMQVLAPNPAGRINRTLDARSGEASSYLGAVS